MENQIHWTGGGRTHAASLRKIAMNVAVAGVVALLLFDQAFRSVEDPGASEGPVTILPAAIKSARTHLLTAEYGATVQQVTVTAGDHVEAGQHMATLTDADLHIAIDKARLRLATAAERLKELEAGGHRDLRLRIFREQYHAAQRAADAATARVSQFSMNDLESSLDHFRKLRTRIEELAAQQMATATEVERSRRDEENAQRALQSGRDQLSRLQQEAEAAAAQVRLGKMQLDLNRNAELDAARAERDQASSQMDLLSKQMSSLNISAQQSGTVTSVDIAPGDRLTPGKALFRVADLSELALEVRVSAVMARQIRPKDRVTVRLPLEPPREISAEVHSVLLAPESDMPSYLVRILVPNPNRTVVLAGLEGAVLFRHINDPENKWFSRLF